MQKMSAKLNSPVLSFISKSALSIFSVVAFSCQLTQVSMATEYNREDLKSHAFEIVFEQQKISLSHLAQGRWASVTGHAVDEILQLSIAMLTLRGHHQEASQIQTQWGPQIQRSVHLTEVNNIGSLDLGDHSPLHQGLAKLYEALEMRLGTPILNVFRLTDINTLNYAIPVVFRPRGDLVRGDIWDRSEYTKHFVPFSGIVTYWTGFGACQLAGTQIAGLQRYCGPIAAAVSTLFRFYLAQRLSYFVFDRFHSTTETIAENSCFIMSEQELFTIELEARQLLQDM